MIRHLSVADADHPRSVHGEGMTMSAQIARHARANPDAVAITQDGIDRTYGELHERISRYANLLHRTGIRRRDRVAVMARNRFEIFEAYFACNRIGAICVPVNFRLTEAEVEYQLTHAGVSLAFTDEPSSSVLIDAVGKEAIPVIVFGPEFEKALAEQPSEYPEHVVDETGPAYIMYTSGTTGRPKGAVLSHQNLMVSAICRTIATGLPPDCRTWLVATALFHIGGFGSTLPAFMVGGRIVLAPGGAFDAEEILGLLANERVANCFLVPSQWHDLIRHPAFSEYDLSALRMIIWGAAPASPTLVRDLLTAFPQASTSTSFGQTETSPTTTALIGQDALAKPGSIGLPLPGVECRIVDAEMNDVPPGEVGEIVYRGPVVMLEYWQDPQATAEAFRGGWFHSGDLVRQDEDGYLHVVDRLKDMIISSGENIYCAEVENVLAAHACVAEVAVIGIPHPSRGEVPVAIVVARGDQQIDGPAIEQWARERLAAYKVPRAYRVVEQLPRSPSGKVLKTVLRDQAGCDQVGGEQS